MNLSSHLDSNIESIRQRCIADESVPLIIICAQPGADLTYDTISAFGQDGISTQEAVEVLQLALYKMKDLLSQHA